MEQRRGACWALIAKHEGKISLGRHRQGDDIKTDI
jgi:hypothetical protein